MATVPDPLLNSASIDFTYTVDPSLPDVPASSESNEVTTRVSLAALDMVKQVDKVYASLNDVITYTVTVTNGGNVDAANVIFRDPIPQNAAFVADSVTVGGVAVPGANPAAGFPLPTIAPGQTTVVTFRVTATGGSLITNAAATTFNFTIDPASPNGASGSATSNQVQTTVQYAQIDYANGGGIVKSEDRQVVELGDIIHYSFALNNTGNVNAGNVVFTDAIPNGTTFVTGSVLWNGVALGGRPDAGLLLGTLAPGVANTLSFDVTVTGTPNPNPIPDFATVAFNYTVNPAFPDGAHGTGTSNTVYAKFVKAGLSTGDVVKTANPTAVKVGDQIAYTFTIHNPGDVDLKNVVLTETMPQYTSFVGGSVTVGGVSQALYNPATGIPIGVVASGATVAVTFRATVTALPPSGQITNIGNVSYTYTVDPNFPDRSGSADSNEAVVAVRSATIDNADGGFVKTVDKAYAQLGDTVTYTLLLQNTGNAPADNTVLSDVLPAGVTLVPGSVVINGTPTPSVTDMSSLPLGTLQPQQTVIVAFDALISSVGADNIVRDKATVTFQYTVASDQPPVQGNGTTNEVQTQIRGADFSGENFTKTGNPAYVELGDIITFTFGIKNAGNASADNVVFKDTLAPELQLVPGSVTFNGAALPGADIAAGVPLGTIAAGSVNTLTFQATAIAVPNPNPVTNVGSLDYTVTVDPTEPPVPGHSDSTPSESTIINAEVTLTKTPDKTVVKVGDTITYTVVATNTGNADVLSTFVVDVLTGGLQFVAGSVTVDGVAQAGASVTSGFDIGPLAVGETKTVTFQALVISLPADQTATNQVTADIEYPVDPSEPPRTKPEESPPTDVEVQDVSLVVTKTANADCVKLGDVLTYTITVQNTGTVTIRNIVVYDGLSQFLLFVDGSATLNGTALPGADILTGINIGQLAPGQSADITYQATVTGAESCKGVITNTAYADYRYSLVSGGADSTGTTGVSSVETSAALPTFRQISLDGCMAIPPQKPCLGTINSLEAEIDVTDYHIIKTVRGTAEDNTTLTGAKLLVSGIVRQIIEYTADDEMQSVHSAHFERRFATHIILPENIAPQAQIRFMPEVEDVYAQALDKRNFFSNVTVNIIAIITKNC